MKTNLAHTGNKVLQESRRISSMTLVWFINTLIISFIALPVAGQLAPGATANFGIDGDIRNDYRQNGTFTAAGTDDWFKTNSGTGIGVIDTTNTNSYKLSLSAGNNISFDKGWSVPHYSTVNGYFLLDARYGRDYFGSGTGSGSDLTTFTLGSKNGADPTTWGTNPGGASIANKSDIIDSYIQFRRNGSVYTGTNPSHLIATVGISTAASNGNRYFDAELYVANLSYNSSTGAFSNSGPTATGGHTAWVFNADGSVKSSGDMSIAFDYTSSAVNSINILIWVSQADYNSVIPKYFNFTPSAYYGASGGYGYAQIQMKSGSASTYGSTNTAITVAPPWGTTSQTLGGASNSYYSANYDVAQFGEASIDLTVLGIDPVLMGVNNQCTPPFTRVLFKSRSSSSFTSALQDFSGPFEFLDAPIPSPLISPAANLTCSNTSVTLSAENYVSGGYYYWTAADSSSISNSQSSSISVAKPGTYYLHSSAIQGCSESMDSVVVYQDIYKPSATAMVSNNLDKNNSTAALMGGDTLASKYSTAHGSYSGLTWSWSGPNAFTSNLQNATTSTAGVYTLIVTETSNGCKDTAMTNVADTTYFVLNTSDISFNAVKVDNNDIKISWAVNEKSIHTLELERSTDGSNFSSISNDQQDTHFQSQYIDNISNLQGTRVYYRLKWTHISGAVGYSEIKSLKISGSVPVALNIFPNPVVTSTNLTFNAGAEQNSIIQIMDVTGKVALQRSVEVHDGFNSITLNRLSGLDNGIYLIRISNGNHIITGRMLKTN